MPSLDPSSARASPTRRFRSSDSTTQGPAIRNGAAPKYCAMSVAGPRQLGGSLALRLGGCPAPAVGERRPHEPGEQRMWSRGPRLELGVELAAYEPRVVRELDHLDQRAVGREPRTTHPVLCQHVAV